MHKNYASQVSAGIIVGISAVIYSVTYGALLFGSTLESFVGYGIAIMLITAAIGALFGLLSEEKSFFSGPDSNTISVLASAFVVHGISAMEATSALNTAVAVVATTSIISSLVFFLVIKFKLAGLIRYIPYSVMAGFLASTGWLMASGALNIMSDIPLTLKGLNHFLQDPMKPQLLFGLLMFCTLFALSSKISQVVLIPITMLLFSVIIHLFLASGLYKVNVQEWLFTNMNSIHWLAPWELNFEAIRVEILLEYLPTMLVVSFVGLLTILLSLASLELTYKKEFDLNKVLSSHVATSGLASFFGGFVGILSISRTTLNKELGGGVISGVVSAVIIVSVMVGIGQFIAYIPKAVLGALLLYLGVVLLKQWIWDQRKTVKGTELIEIITILGMVISFGYLVGFFVGILISSVIFVVTFSKVPLTSLVTTLNIFQSSAVRPLYTTELLYEHGEKTLIFRLRGYIFFGSASRIDSIVSNMNVEKLDCMIIDFSDVSGIDSSAISVFQRILRRYASISDTSFFIVQSETNSSMLQIIATDSLASKNLSYYLTLDNALEQAEENTISKYSLDNKLESCFEFLTGKEERDLFISYCSLMSLGVNEILAHQGDMSNAIFFIEYGSVGIFNINRKGEKIRLAKMYPGSIIGEISFYTNKARSASMIAIEESKIYVLEKESYEKMHKENSFLANKLDLVVISKISNSLLRANMLISNIS